MVCVTEIKLGMFVVAAVRPYPYIHPDKYPRPSWAIDWEIREDGAVEDTCKHGVGHPNYWQLLSRQQKWPDAKIRGVHGCDGCCGFGSALLEVWIT